MINYIKENYSVFAKVLDILVDSSPATEWKSEEHRIEFKNLNLAGYRDFLYQLSNVEIQANSQLYQQYQFCQNLFRLCDRYKSIGSDAFNGNEIKYYELLKENMWQWLKQDLNLVLKESERKHYTKLAFDYKNEGNASVQFNSYLASTKEAAMNNIHKKVNFG